MDLLNTIFISAVIILAFGAITYSALREFKELSDPDIVDRRADLRRIRIIIELIILWCVAAYIWYVLIQERTDFFPNL